MITIKRGISFTAESRKKDSEETEARVRCVVTWNRHRIRLDVGFSVNLSAWLKDTQRCRAKSIHGSDRTPAAVINRGIDDFEEIVHSVFYQFEQSDTMPAVEELKRAIELRLYPERAEEDDGRQVIFPIYDKYILDGIATGRWKLNSLKKVKVVRNHLYRMSPTLTFQDLDEDGLRKLIAYMSTVKDKQNRKGVANHTITKVLAMIKSFLRWSIENGYCENNRLINQRTRLKSAQRPVIFLTWDELMAVYNHDFGNRHYLSNVRDVFCFCCFTSLRFSDVKELRRSDIHGDSIVVTTVKTDDNLTIELNKYSKAILDKYKDAHLPNGKVFPIISNQKTNDYIKMVAKECGIDAPVKLSTYKGVKREDSVHPKWELLSTHAGRRTFISNALMLGIPPNIVMKWTGHSDYKAMKPYIDIADSAKKEAMTAFDKLK